MAPLVIVAIVIFVTGMLLVGMLFALRSLAVGRERAAQIRFPNARAIVSGANFFGQESSGVGQLRGNGTLVLTDQELYFERWLPQREYRIPLSAIHSIETPTAFLGKSNSRPLLKVNYQDADGNTDAMAWLLPDLAGFKRQLEESLSSVKL
jgi:hypothetical protein